jgi:hypothetical protein
MPIWRDDARCRWSAIRRSSLAFIAFNVIATGGGLKFNQVPQALGQGAIANDTQLVGAVLWALWCLTLSMGAIGMAYFSRAAWKLDRMRV